MNRNAYRARAATAVALLLVGLFSLTAVADAAQSPGQNQAQSQGEAEASAQALQVMEDFLAAFNARDEAAWADTLHYPHVRLASQTVAVYPDRAAFIADHDLDAFARNTGWHRSTWDDLQVIQASPEKVHIAVVFTRYNAADEVLAAYRSIYVLEHIDGRWGIRARSSFAP